MTTTHTNNNNKNTELLEEDSCSSSHNRNGQKPPPSPMQNNNHHRRHSKKKKKLLLPTDHPLQAFIPDTKIFIELLTEEPYLLQCDELEFMRTFLLLSSKFTDDDDDVVVDDDVEMEERKVVVDETGTSSSGRIVEHDEKACGLMNDDDSADNAYGLEDAVGSGDKHIGSVVHKGRQFVGKDMKDKDGQMDDDEEEEEEGYWDNDISPDAYIWPKKLNNDKSTTTTTAAAASTTNVNNFEEEEEEDDIETYEVIIIGAGPSGIGVSISLRYGGLRSSSFLVLEQNTVGNTFDQWNTDTRFISPSWYTNPFGCVDLNSVEPFSSVAAVIGRGENDADEEEGEEHTRCTDDDGDGMSQSSSQHPSGKQYATYLRTVASKWKLPIRERCKVVSIQKVPGTETWPGGGFKIETEQQSYAGRPSSPVEGGGGCDGSLIRRKKTLYSRYVVWCGGEWSYPKLPPAVVSALPPPSQQQESTTSDAASQGASSNSAKHFEEGTFVHYAHLGNDEKKWTDMVHKANSNPVPIVESYNQEAGGGSRTRRTGGHIIIVGGHESGVDAACKFLRLGVDHVTIIDGSKRPTMGKNHNNGNSTFDPDPSISLSPESKRRLRLAYKTGKLTLLTSYICTGCGCVRVDANKLKEEREEDCVNSTECHHQSASPPFFAVHVRKSPEKNALSAKKSSTVSKREEVLLLNASVPIVMCTGFDLSRCDTLTSLVEFSHPPDDNFPIVSQSCDESLRTPGLFVCGPMLRHRVKKKRLMGKSEDGSSSSCRRLDDIISWANNNDEVNGDVVHSGESTNNSKKKGNSTTAAASSSMSLKEEEEDAKEIIFCFIYKFRTRFAVVAGEILSRLIYDDNCVMNQLMENDEDAVITTTSKRTNHGGRISEQTSNNRSRKEEEEEGNFKILIDRVGHERMERLESMLTLYRERGMLMTDLNCALLGGDCDDKVC